MAQRQWCKFWARVRFRNWDEFRNASALLNVISSHLQHKKTAMNETLFRQILKMFVVFSSL